MSKIKMIVTDLDRTLLRTDKTISDYTSEVLIRCRTRGIKVVFATARPKNRVDILPFVDIADAIITDNGSTVYKADEIVNSFGIPAEVAKPVIKEILDSFPNERISIEYPNVKVANFDNSELWQAEIRNDIAHPLDIDATKIVVNAGAEICNEVCALLPDELYAQLCEGQLILIMYRSATKWNAIQAVASHFGISTADIVAFGDDYNDIEMLQNCGIGVAVVNALDEAKAVADFICDSNDENGVAKWLERNVPSVTTDLPSSIQSRLDGFTCVANTVGCSNASVLMFSNEQKRLFLKTDRRVKKLQREHDVLCWLAGKLPVPKVVEWHEDTENAYLLMTEATGHMSCENGDYDAISPLMETTVKLLADGLKMLQTVDITDCPFENRLTQKLEEALYNIEHGLVDMGDFEEGKEFDTPLELYHWLQAHQPAEELVFVHGDYCLPNVFIDGEGITGFIDVGNAGVADKWQDIALCVRSLGYNLFLGGREREKEKYTALLFACLGFPPNWEKINYYILLDELF